MHSRSYDIVFRECELFSPVRQHYTSVMVLKEIVINPAHAQNTKVVYHCGSTFCGPHFSANALNCCVCKKENL